MKKVMVINDSEVGMRHFWWGKYDNINFMDVLIFQGVRYTFYGRVYKGYLSSWENTGGTYLVDAVHSKVKDFL